MTFSFAGLTFDPFFPLSLRGLFKCMNGDQGEEGRLFLALEAKEKNVFIA